MPKVKKNGGLILAKTLHPFPDFAASAQVLNHLHLGQTRKNVIVLMTFLRDNEWHGQPAVDMWRPYSYWLMRYGVEIMREWSRRGYTEGKAWLNLSEVYGELPLGEQRRTDRPHWLGGHAFHLSHQSNLIRREIASEQKALAAGRKSLPIHHHYRDAFPGVAPDLEYVWPTMS